MDPPFRQCGYESTKIKTVSKSSPPLHVVCAQSTYVEEVAADPFAARPVVAGTAIDPSVAADTAVLWSRSMSLRVSKTEGGPKRFRAGLTTSA